MGNAVLAEYRNRTGRDPLRMVIHKQSKFDEQEKDGFSAAAIVYQVMNSYHCIPPTSGCFLKGTIHLEEEPLLTLRGLSIYTPPGSSSHGPAILALIYRDPWKYVLILKAKDEERSCQEILGLTKMYFNSHHLLNGLPSQREWLGKSDLS